MGGCGVLSGRLVESGWIRVAAADCCRTDSYCCVFFFHFPCLFPIAYTLLPIHLYTILASASRDEALFVKNQVECHTCAAPRRLLVVEGHVYRACAGNNGKVVAGEGPPGKWVK